MSEHITEQNAAQESLEESEISPEQLAEKVIRYHVYMSLGVGLVPIPFIDFVGVTGIQLTLLKKLAKIYDTPFSRDMVKNIIGVLIGGAFPASLSPRVAASFAKTIPGIGQSLGAVGGASVSGASTYAVGKVFNRHFAEGGTFLSFDPDNAREFYEAMFREGKKVVTDIKKKKNNEADTV
ncbi:MAG: DUF697 domain-containing protein [Candidatus Electrothrix aestuarii]|uniref:DUF697 domain-containing protein n=1 Tax=Candidatus Electrothrix aestuarii TaxID=3062594 RepID=A0AAU8LX28_9BACT